MYERSSRNLLNAVCDRTQLLSRNLRVPPPYSGRSADDSAESSCKMSLVREPGNQRDLAEGLACRQHELLCALDAPPQDECVRADAKTRLEGALKITGAQMDGRRELLC